MRAREEVDHGCRCGQEHQAKSHEKVCTAPEKQTKAPRKCHGDDRGGEKDDSVQPSDTIQPPDEDIVEPLPGKPWVAGHSRRKWINPGNRVGSEDQLPGAYMPTNSRVAQQSHGQIGEPEQTEQGDENQVPDGGNKPSACRGRIRLFRTSGADCHRAESYRVML